MNHNRSPLVFAVPPAAAGQRLDRWLAGQLLETSRSAVQRWIADGYVLLNGQRPAKSGLPLTAGTQITVHVPALAETSLHPENIPLQILYEDRDLLVINKPPGLVVHPGPGHPTGTLVNAVLHHCSDLEGIGDEKRPGIVHRLDKGTSGLIVVAKNDAAMRYLQEQFAVRTVFKGYLTLLEGRITPSQGRIDAPIGRHPRQRQRMAVLPAARGRPALTDYETLRSYETQVGGRTARLSLIRAILYTGRTHQIRVHFAWRKHPVVGDTDYGYRQPRLPLGRPFLHAHRLGICLPATGKQQMFEAPLPSDLQHVLDQLDEAQK